MTINIDKAGTIYLFQGDSGEIYIEGLPTDKDYKVYFAVRNINRQPIGDELISYSNNEGGVKFFLNSSFTDQFVVSEEEPFATYQYGLKICSTENEDTLTVSGMDFGCPNNMIVFPKLVEGTYEQQ